MAPLVPLESRRDLKPPAFLHLDPAAALPAPVRAREGCRPLAPLRPVPRPPGGRDARARRCTALFPLRPCDYAFEPHPELPLGLGCVFAQVRSCAAPCLGRVSEDDYRALAARAEAWLARPAGASRGARRGAAARRPRVVRAGARRRPGPERESASFPCEGGRVLDDAAATVGAGRARGGARGPALGRSDRRRATTGRGCSPGCDARRPAPSSSPSSPATSRRASLAERVRAVAAPALRW